MLQEPSLLEKDRAFIWHPFTQAQREAPPLVIERGSGSYLYDEKGAPYLDAIASWWVNLHGHAHPYIARALKKQVDLLEHVLFAGCTHRGAIELAERLLPLLPGKMGKLFYSDNGSTAVEVGLKIGIQYFGHLYPQGEKPMILAFKGGYHGDTFGAMAVAGKHELNEPFWNFLFDVHMIDPPFKGKEKRALDQLTALLQRKKGGACFLFEPLILGVGGMRTYSAEGLDALLAECQRFEVLTIADEVMTGFGRTGTLFACEQLQHSPDIICLSKGVTGGFLPLGVTACTEAIYSAFLSDDPRKALLHGHSYTANPLACASALASLDLLEGEESRAQREMIAKAHRIFAMRYESHPRLKRCEAFGTLLIVEYLSPSFSYFNGWGKRVARFFLERRILVRPLGDVIYILPPYSISQEELETIYATLASTFEEDTWKR